MAAPLRRVGLELEFPVVEVATGRGMGRSAAERLWHSFAARDPSWQLEAEVLRGAVTGVCRTESGFLEVVNTDTGVCTVEVALAPQETIGAAVDAAVGVLRGLQEPLAAMGYTMLSTGIQPRTWFDPARKSPKDWYLLLPRRWRLHHWLVPIASHQASVDVSPGEAARAVNVLSGFAGIFVALTAGSPVARGALQPWKEMRNWVWQERCARVPVREALYTSNGMPARPYPHIGSYIEHFWDSHLYFLTKFKSGGYEVVGDRSFKDFILSPRPVRARRIDGTLVEIAPERDMLDRIHQYGWPAAKLHYRFDSATDLDGVRAALTEGRMADYFERHAVGCYVENRTCGVAPHGEEGVTAALTMGLVERLDDAEALLARFPWEYWCELWATAGEHGLGAADPRLLGTAREMLELAQDGLRGRGAGEEVHLLPLLDRLERRETPADRMIAAFGAGGVRRLVREFGRPV
ncbi:glutamate-cysteine ligase family protein [Allonocardiopsis opalescens]|uniref:glutamate--cysteine ligase n=1 Tax=Allonocardiopsis opalescens TaxID=1144618 RepID=A0A2T0Q1I8_9ACTN|nr:glutamate-cysteine ligase family protein [Allonocardiopsis opalescens]PRX97663.1 gamma-glutamylcysteine synthetase [Allonocardiopsis opalescens]